MALILLERRYPRKINQNIGDALRSFSVINFNYDRCFEHFTYFWLQELYGLSELDAANLVEEISIFHPYGKIGDLPFQSPNDHVPFGGKVSGERLVNIMRRIRTYSETLEGETELDSALTLLHNSKKVVFLGFGFHEQNMMLLNRSHARTRPTLQCYSTMHKVPAARQAIFRERIRSSFNITSSGGLFTEKSPHNCEGFWADYGETILSP